MPLDTKTALGETTSELQYAKTVDEALGRCPEISRGERSEKKKGNNEMVENSQDQALDIYRTPVSVEKRGKRG